MNKGLFSVFLTSDIIYDGGIGYVYNIVDSS